MHIKTLEITNFKCFTGEIPALNFNTPNGEDGSGLNIFVGENNTGKSTIFEAIDYVRNGSKKSNEQLKNINHPGDAIVHLIFEGDINSVVDGFSQPNKVNVFKKYIFGVDNNRIKFSRRTNDSKAISLWSEADGEYNNESGIDAPVKKLFEANFVWADTNPNDEVSFGATTICGNLLKEIANSFTETAGYKAFSEKFHETFNSDDSGLRKALKNIEIRTQEIFKEQFGTAGISFRFDELKVESFFKNTIIDIDDGVKTSMDEKGSGMQRVIALALLQVYAEELIKHPENDVLKKPFFLFIDEPEICLHPMAQKKLLDALLKISKTKQVFLATHSPYFIATEHLQRIGLFVFKKNNGVSTIQSLSGIQKLLPWSPTWAEINFNAYQLPTVEFHNELYGRLQEISSHWKIHDFDNWLQSKGFPKTNAWTKENNGIAGMSESVSLQTFIRNKIHHPENQTMQSFPFTQEDLGLSISAMKTFLEGMGNTQVVQE